MEEADGNYDATAGFLQQLLDRFRKKTCLYTYFSVIYTLNNTKKKWGKGFTVAEKSASETKDNTIATSIHFIG